MGEPIRFVMNLPQLVEVGDGYVTKGNPSSHGLYSQPLYKGDGEGVPGK